MPKEAGEKYMEWLEREEESLGIGAVQRGTMDIEELRAMLYDELGYAPTDAQLDAFMGTATTRYEVMPEVRVTSLRVERPWGYQMMYRDVATGRFMSYADLSSRVTEYWRARE